MTTAFIDRMESELAELSNRWNKLDGFIGTEKFYALSEWHRTKLVEQRASMRAYAGVLGERLTALKAEVRAK